MREKGNLLALPIGQPEPSSSNNRCFSGFTAVMACLISQGSDVSNLLERSIELGSIGGIAADYSLQQELQGVERAFALVALLIEA